MKTDLLQRPPFRHPTQRESGIMSLEYIIFIAAAVTTACIAIPSFLENMALYFDNFNETTNSTGVLE